MARANFGTNNELWRVCDAIHSYLGQPRGSHMEIETNPTTTNELEIQHIKCYDLNGGFVYVNLAIPPLIKCQPGDKDVLFMGTVINKKEN